MIHDSGSTFDVGMLKTGDTRGYRKLCPWTLTHEDYTETPEPRPQAFISHFRHSQELADYYKAHTGSVAEYAGACHADWVILDIDSADLTAALSDTRQLYQYLVMRYPELDGLVPIYFSGSKGFHVYLPVLSVIPPSVDFPAIAKAMCLTTAAEAVVKIDPTIYCTTQIVRLPNTYNLKTADKESKFPGYLKRHLTAAQLFSLTIDEIQELALTASAFTIPTPPESPLLTADWLAAAEAVAKEEAERHRPPTPPTPSQTGYAGGGWDGELMVPVSASRPCPVCGKPDYCLIQADGSKAICGRTESRKRAGEAGWLHWLTEPPKPQLVGAGWVKKLTHKPAALAIVSDHLTDDDTEPTPPDAIDEPTPPHESSWAALAAEFEAKMTEAERQALADSLGVPVDATRQLQVGVYERKRHGTTFTFAETDSGGNVVGINRRYPNGEKFLLKGGKRGLYIPLGWEDCGGCVCLVEGATDTLALTAAGLSAIGRPDCSGGAKHLVELLAGCDREIVVVGENDLKPDGSHPGKNGAESLARVLCRALKRPITVSFPPADAKDVRAWLTHPDRAGTPWADRGAELRGLLADAATITANPPPVIWPSPDEYGTTDQAIKAMAAEPDLYSRAGVLVFVDPLPPQFVDSPPKATIAKKPSIRERLSRCAEWLTIKKEGGNEVEVRTHPPTWCVDQVMSRGRWEGIREITSIVEYPVILPGGDMLASSGYHAGTGVVAQLPPCLTLTVPTTPTAEDVQAARDTLLDPICDFPFVDDAARSAIVAALLTPLAWHAFDGPAPFFLVDKNTRGTGSGLLVDVVGLILTGRRMTPSVYPRNQDEMSKTVLTVAMEGRPVVLFDNLTGNLGDGPLDAALTATSFTGRVLGVNQSATAALNVVWYGTGNNVQVGDDTARRVCRVRMHTDLEKPEARTGFRYPNLREHVREHRSQYLTAALTILRGWYAAGCPRHGLPSLGSYEGWSGVVREAVVFAGLADPGEAIMSASATETDPDTAAVAVILSVWDHIDPCGQGVTSRQIIEASLGLFPEPGSWKAELRDALGELLGANPEPRQLGDILSRFVERNMGGLRLEAIRKTNTVNRWVVQRVV